MHIYFSSPFYFIVVDVMMFERVHEVMLNALFKYAQLAYEPCKRAFQKYFRFEILWERMMNHLRVAA